MLSTRLGERQRGIHIERALVVELCCDGSRAARARVSVDRRAAGVGERASRDVERGGVAGVLYTRWPPNSFWTPHVTFEDAALALDHVLRAGR